MPTCLIDQTEHATLEDLHKYLQFKLKVKQADYYTKYQPRKDWLTKEPIPFKNREQYLAAEFLNRDNLNKWIAANPAEGREWVVRWLAKRRDEKHLAFPPTQVEMASLIAPTIHSYERYNVLCVEIGYEIRFDGVLDIKSLPPTASIIVDSREQKPLTLSVPTIRDKVNCGDYSLDPDHDLGVYIERKSLNDFVGTLSDRKTRGEDSNLDRFTRELERAQECGAYLIVLVEDTLERTLDFDSLPEFSKLKISPDHIFKNLRDLLHRFVNLQALFVNGRGEAARAVVKLLAAGSSVKKTDLQFSYESGRLYLKD